MAKIHRASSLPEDTVYWHKDGVLHREDGPAVIHPDGSEEWFVDGMRHRTDGPAYTSGDQKQTMWFYRGHLHCPDGPALTLVNGTRKWYVYGKRHRTDGPAIEWFNGDCEYYLNDVLMTEREFTLADKDAHHPPRPAPVRADSALQAPVKLHAPAPTFARLRRP